jgi:hypothetical protein
MFGKVDFNLRKYNGIIIFINLKLIYKIYSIFYIKINYEQILVVILIKYFYFAFLRSLDISIILLSLLTMISS